MPENKTAQSVAYHKAYSRALYRLRDRYSEQFEQWLAEEYAELGYAMRVDVKGQECTRCGDPVRCKGLCERCYAYERRTGKPRPDEMIEQQRERDRRRAAEQIPTPASA